MRFKRQLGLLLVCILMCNTLVIANAEASDSRYSYSWVANDYSGFENEWGIGTQVPHEVAAMYVTPDGTAYTNCDWEEDGHNFAEIRDGKITNIGWGSHGWGYEGGLAVTANDKYVFFAQKSHNEGGNLGDTSKYPPYGYDWQGVQRRTRDDIKVGAYFSGGTGRDGDNGQQIRYSFKPVMTLPYNSYTYITGMAATNEKLFVSSLKANKIWVYNAETMAEIAVWDVDSPNTIVLDKNGVLWVNQKSTNKIISYDQNGKKLKGEISFDAGVVPFAMCVDNQNRLMIGDQGANEWILVYKNLDSTPTLSHTIGAKGGIYSGTPGEIGDMKFYHITGIGVDAKDNLYVASGSAYYLFEGNPQSGKGNPFIETGGTHIQSYDKNNKKLWELRGLNFVDNIAVDPEDETVIYTDFNKFKLDYTQSPGQEWSYEAFTFDPHKYPDDMRAHAGNTSFAVATQVVTVQGHKYLLMSDMGASILSVYRFNEETDGEIAIPCAVFNRANGGGVAWPPNCPVDTPYLWVDNDGDGQMDANEYRSIPGDFNSEGRNWEMDTNGNLYRAGNQTNSVETLSFKSINQYGVIDWNTNNMKSFSLASQYPGGNVRRISYDEAKDTMYIMVQTEQTGIGWLEGGQHVVAYKNWSNASKRSVMFKVTMPLMQKEVNANTYMAPIGMSVSGDYVFVGYNFKTLTYVLNKKTGELYDIIIPPEEQGTSWALVDTCYSYASQQLSNGEYVIFVEDDLKSKNFMIRWSDQGGTKNYNADKAWGVYVDNRQVMFGEFQPYFASGTLVVPYSVVRAMGASVYWGVGSNSLRITAANGTQIVLTAESDIAYVNGRPQAMDARARIRRGMFYIPIANVTMMMGGDFNRNSAENLFEVDMDDIGRQKYGNTTFE